MHAMHKHMIFAAAPAAGTALRSLSASARKLCVRSFYKQLKHNSDSFMQRRINARPAFKGSLKTMAQSLPLCHRVVTDMPVHMQAT